MIPDRLQIGADDVASWRVLPAECNPHEEELGAWAVTAGDTCEGGDTTLYFEILDAERPLAVAEFIVEAVQRHARRLHLKMALAEVQRELDRQLAQARSDEAGEPDLSPMTKLAVLMEEVGEVAGVLTYDHQLDDRAEQDSHLYAELTQVVAVAVGWMQAPVGLAGGDVMAGVDDRLAKGA